MITDPQSTTGPAHAAVRNNADWCDAVCRSHGVPGAVEGGVWASPRRTPPLYPDAVTLSPDATSEAVVARIDLTSPGASVKDSFGSLDLVADGFEVLFEAQWVHRAATDPGRGPAGWRAVEDHERLSAWEAAWSGDGAEGGPLFRPALLDDGTVFLADAAHGNITAGAVAHLAAGVVGVSNLFTADDDLDAAWRSCLEATDRLWPGVPVVGYEHGETLAAAVRQGFEPVGPLRVWLRTDG
ncbi:hypothetical protein [Streptomyces sp. KL118A]|uniref:hypothetical protein n=1 Tax=Streptomyces sp. KL118A TaxID=3045153 RepID=UPI00278BC9B9|nr:hypothetical protein [Streptomyces sp. KL118A]